MTEESLMYPIGKFVKPENFTREEIKQYKLDIAAFPMKLRKEVAHLTEEQLDTPYRPDGWTVRQVVNHCADSHMNSLMRFKLALTEDQPTIRPYYEDRWATLADSNTISIIPALHLLDGLHARWSVLLESLSVFDLKRTFIHPSGNQIITLEENIGIYAWHGNHHLAHITSLKQRENWQ